MARPTWPVGLPSPFAEGEPTYLPYQNVVATANDTGPPKRRRRFTGMFERFQFKLVLAGETQRALFWNFYDGTLSEVLPFDWTDKRTGQTRTYCFAYRPPERWVAGPEGDGWWEVTVELETR